MVNFPRLHPLLVVLLIGIAGCAAPSGTPASPTPDRPIQQSFPPLPAEVTADNAGEYAAGFEEMYRHNSILASTREARVESISVNCNVMDVSPSNDGFLVTVQCGFSWTFRDDGSVGVADGLPYDATYWVSGGLVERIGSTLANQ